MYKSKIQAFERNYLFASYKIKIKLNFRNQFYLIANFRIFF